MKALIIVAFLLTVVKSDCCKKENNCKGEPVKDCVCIQIYKTVCGCDGKTYGNNCVARCEGVKEWKEGECPSLNNNR